MAETFVSEMPEVTIEGGLVRTAYRSGNEVTRTISTVAFMRRYHEAGIRRLNEWEAANRGEVVPIKRKRRAH